jgi:SAM-dependent methyltransferase
MKKSLWIVLVLLACGLTIAGAAAQEFTPSIGQEGKDVIWVPTPDNLIAAMLDAAKVMSTDYVVDLGSGDGRIVIAAAQRGAKATGYEFNPDMVELSKHSAEKAGVSQRATFQKADIFEVDFSQATVVTMYLLPQLNLRLRPTILNMKPGTRVVSNSFSMGEWPPDQTLDVDYRNAYLWIVPAKVDGVWAIQSGSGSGELKLSQEFQNLKGTLTHNGKDLAITDAKLEGDRIRFTAGDSNYSGRVNGKTMEGTTRKNGSEATWSATLRQTSQ